MPSPKLSDSNVKRFAALFDGYSKAHGEAAHLRADETGKVQARHKTLRGGPTLDHYRRHLEGGENPGLGIILLRDDNTVSFGAIDYDNKTTDHAKAEAEIRKRKLPLIVCRSKSGGAHFYCFTTVPVPANLMRDRLAEWTALLGMAASTEQFPKQSARFSDDDIGSFINIPYYQHADTVRYAVKDGKAVDLKTFLDMAEAARVTPEALAKTDLQAPGDEDDIFFEGPPCLQYLANVGGFSEGTRNMGMTAVAVYLKRRFPDSWREKIDEYNAKLAELPSSEIQSIIKTYARRDYGYQCKQAPINAHCQRRLCLGRKFGVGETDPEQRGYDINGMTRYDSSTGDEPMWGMEVNGKRVLVSTQQLYSRDEFNKACITQANVLPIHMPPQRWLKFLGGIIPTADVVNVPTDASATGQLWEWIEQFLTQQVPAQAKEEVWLGKVFKEDGAVYFRSKDLFKYLNDRRVNYKTEQRVWHILRDRGAESKFWNIRGKGVNVWTLKAPDSPEDPGASPLPQQKEEF